MKDYHIVSQGKTVIPGLDDGEEMKLTDVSPALEHWLVSFCLLLSFSFCLLAASLRIGYACVCQVFLGVHRKDDDKQPHDGLSPHMSGEDAYTWSQRR